MSLWREFEEDIGQLVELFGYGGEVTKASGDQGVDVLARRGSRVVAIQCKLHESGKVGSTAIQKLLASRVIHGATDFICFTTGTYTKHARELAGQTGTILIDRTGLLTVCRANSLTLTPRSFLRLGDDFVPVTHGARVGRESPSDIVIADPFVSAHHARFERQGLRLYLIDSGSSNGTSLNQSRVSPLMRYPVTYGDRICFGRIETELTMDGF